MGLGRRYYDVDFYRIDSVPLNVRTFEFDSVQMELADLEREFVERQSCADKSRKCHIATHAGDGVEVGNLHIVKIYKSFSRYESTRSVAPVFLRTRSRAFSPAVRLISSSEKNEVRSAAN